MGLNLQTDRVLIVEFNETGVVDKSRQHEPGLPFSNFFGSFPNELSKNTIDFHGFSVDGMLQVGIEDAMFTVLAPGLGEHLNFNLGRVPIKFLKILFNQRKVVPGEGQPLFLTERLQFVPIHRPKRNGGGGFVLSHSWHNPAHSSRESRDWQRPVRAFQRHRRNPRCRRNIES